MLELPRIPYKMSKNKSQPISMRGINYTNVLSDGDMADSKGISARSYPYITTRERRDEKGDYAGATAAVAFAGGFVIVKENELLFNGSSVGAIAPGEKQFAQINSKLVIMPDKKYLDGETMTLCDMESELVSDSTVFTSNSITLVNGAMPIAKGYGYNIQGNTLTVKSRETVGSYTVKTNGQIIYFLETGIPKNIIVGNLYTFHMGWVLGESYADKKITAYVNKINDRDEDPFIVISESFINKYQARVTITREGWSEDFSNVLSVGDIIKIGGTKLNNQSLTVSSVTSNTITFNEALKEEISEFGELALYRVSSGTGNVGINNYFKQGDAITIYGGANDGKTFVIDEINGNVVVASSDIFVPEENSEIISFKRKIPDLDFICESNNRIWGCSNADNTIYASALGDPTNFFDYSGESTDSYAVAVGSPERFTACCRYGDSVLFFKEMKIHKILGSYPSEYTLYSYDIEGVQSGCEKSLQVINEVLYYKGIHGVFAFTGSPSLISAKLGEKKFSGAVAGNDGDTLYISMTDGERNYLFAYETKYGMWVLEDDIRVTDFIRVGGDMYMLQEGGKFYLTGAGDSEAGIEWHIQFAPFYETISGQKSYSRIVMRLELLRGSHIGVDVRTDGGAWREAGKVVGKRDGIVPVMIPINRCDKFEVRLRGKGKATIHSMVREFFVGGDK